MLATLPDLLAALGWPSAAGQEPGTLTWTRASNEEAATRIYSASVVLTPKAVVCRLRSAAVAQPWVLKSHMEAVWDTQTVQPYMTKWVVDGQPRNAYEVDSPRLALEDFRDAVENLDVEPKLMLNSAVNRRSR